MGDFELQSIGFLPFSLVLCPLGSFGGDVGIGVNEVVALLGDWRSSAGARGEHLSKVVIGPPGQCGSGGLKDLPPTSNMMVLSSSFLVLGSLDPFNS